MFRLILLTSLHISVSVAVGDHSNFCKNGKDKWDGAATFSFGGSTSSTCEESIETITGVNTEDGWSKYKTKCASHSGSNNVAYWNNVELARNACCKDKQDACYVDPTQLCQASTSGTWTTPRVGCYAYARSYFPSITTDQYAALTCADVKASVNSQRASYSNNLGSYASMCCPSVINNSTFFAQLSNPHICSKESQPTPYSHSGKYKVWKQEVFECDLAKSKNDDSDCCDSDGTISKPKENYESAEFGDCLTYSGQSGPGGPGGETYAISVKYIFTPESNNDDDEPPGKFKTTYERMFYEKSSCAGVVKDTQTLYSCREEPSSPSASTPAASYSKYPNYPDNKLSPESSRMFSPLTYTTFCPILNSCNRVVANGNSASPYFYKLSLIEEGATKANKEHDELISKLSKADSSHRTVSLITMMSAMMIVAVALTI
jgi:hypothetical protein